MKKKNNCEKIEKQYKAKKRSVKVLHLKAKTKKKPIKAAFKKLRLSLTDELKELKKAKSKHKAAKKELKKLKAECQDCNGEKKKSSNKTKKSKKTIKAFSNKKDNNSKNKKQDFSKRKSIDVQLTRTTIIKTPVQKRKTTEVKKTTPTRVGRVIKANTTRTNKPSSNPKTTRRTTSYANRVSGKDNLRLIEGIGPKIEELLNNSGIKTFKELAVAKVDKLKSILVEGGSRFSFHNPGTWPEQSKLAAASKWDELKKWQDELKGGK